MSSTASIPFNRPYLSGDELDLVADALLRAHLSGDGHFTAEAQRRLAVLTGASAPLLTTSCTHALELGALLLGLAEGDEVIVPSFTHPATVNAMVLRGARPVFVDCRPDTLNLDETAVEGLVTARTRAVVVMHYAGVGCEMDTVMDVAERHGLAVVEDNAHGLGGTYRGKPLGSFGALSALSFHATKNVQCGEGGALLVNDASLTARAEVLRHGGTNRGAFVRGDVDRYTWVDVGSSYVPSDVLAAVLVAQLDRFDQIQAARQERWAAYDSALRAWADACGAATPTVPAHCEHPAHLYHLLLPDAANRDRFIAHLATQGVQSVFHYVPLHSSPMGRALGNEQNCPVTDDVSARLVRLPLYPDLDASRQDRVIEAVRSFEVQSA